MVDLSPVAVVGPSRSRHRPRSRAVAMAPPYSRPDAAEIPTVWDCGMYGAALNSPQSLSNDGERDHGARTFNPVADEAARAGRGRRGALGGHRSADGIVGVTGELVAGRPSARDRDDPPAGARRRGHGDRQEADRARLS